MKDLSSKNKSISVISNKLSISGYSVISINSQTFFSAAQLLDIALAVGGLP